MDNSSNNLNIRIEVVSMIDLHHRDHHLLIELECDVMLLLLEETIQAKDHHHQGLLLLLATRRQIHKALLLLPMHLPSRDNIAATVLIAHHQEFPRGIEAISDHARLQSQPLLHQQQVQDLNLLLSIK